MNLHSLMVPDPLCTFSWETQLIDLQPPQFNLSAVRTGSCTGIQAPPSSASRAQDGPCPQAALGGPPCTLNNAAIKAREKSLQKADAGCVRGLPSAQRDLCLPGARPGPAPAAFRGSSCPQASFSATRHRISRLQGLEMRIV